MSISETQFKDQMISLKPQISEQTVQWGRKGINIYPT